MKKLLCIAACSLLAVEIAAAQPVESYRSDYSADQVAASRALQARALASQAFLYYLPAFVHVRQLTEFIQGRQYFSPKETPLGGWVLVRKLSDPTTDNVLPNVDTLYGASYIWIKRQGPVVLSVPAVTDRYYSVAMLDAWLNNFAYVGTRSTGMAAGDYLIVPPGWTGAKPTGIRAVIQAPTPVINLFQRIYVRNTEADVAAVRKLQDQIRLTPLASYLAKSNEPFPAIDLSTFAIPGIRHYSAPADFFQLMSFYTRVNPPPVEDTHLVAAFSSVGIGPGSKLPDEPALRAALAQGFADGREILNGAISGGPFRNGWTVPDPNTGRPGPHLLARAVVQMTAMGVNIPEEALYFPCYRDATGAVLNGSKRYTLTFKKDAQAPVESTGFWSLTLYNSQGYLAKNPIDRYQIRRDTEGLRINPDGSLTIYIQTEPPEGDAAANWLPAPKGNFQVNLRTYVPTRRIATGEWFPPGIEPVK